MDGNGFVDKVVITLAIYLSHPDSPGWADRIDSNSYGGQ